MGEEARSPYTTAPDQGAAHLEYTQLQEEVTRLRQECTRLRRLLVAVLPPDALYQEARQLARALRQGE